MSQIVFIAGCSSGIGLATAKHLASDSLKRFLVYATVLQTLDEEEEFRKTMTDHLDVTAFAIQMDITNDKMVTEAISHVMSKHGKIDIMINISGVNNVNATEAISKTVMKRVFDINFFGMVRLTQQVLPVMKKQRSGRIIIMGSVHGICAFPFNPIYGASKQAIIGFCQEVATIGRFFNIRVSVIEPGGVSTRINENMSAQGLGGVEVISKNPNIGDIERKLSTCWHHTEVFHPSLLSDANSQQPIEIAQLILAVATAEKPHFRYQTSPACRALADRFLKDITGDSVIDYHEEELRKFTEYLEKKEQKDG